MILKYGSIWAVLACKRLTYFKRKPSLKTVARVIKRHESLNVVASA